MYVVTRESDVRIRFYLVEKTSKGVAVGCNVDTKNEKNPELYHPEWYEKKFKELNSESIL